MSLSSEGEQHQHHDIDENNVTMTRGVGEHDSDDRVTLDSSEGDGVNGVDDDDAENVVAAARDAESVDAVKGVGKDSTACVCSVIRYASIRVV